MKFFAVLLVLLVTSAAANAQTVGDLVDSLCAPVKAQLSDPEGDFSTLFAALNAINDVELNIPPGNVTLIAPVNKVFVDAFAILGVTPEVFLTETDTLTKVIGYHIIGGTTTAEGTDAKIDNSTITIEGTLAPVPISSKIEECAADGLTVLTVDTPVVPLFLLDMFGPPGPTMAPAPAPAKTPSPSAKAPTPTPAATPKPVVAPSAPAPSTSGAAAAALSVAAGVALVAGMLA